MKIMARLILGAILLFVLFVVGMLCHDRLSQPRPNDSTKRRILYTLSASDQLDWGRLSSARVPSVRPKADGISVQFDEFTFLPKTNNMSALGFRFYHNPGGRYAGSYDGKYVTFWSCGSGRLWEEGEFDAREVARYRTLQDVIVTNVVERGSYGKTYRYVDVIGWHGLGERETYRIHNPTPEQQGALHDLLQERLAEHTFPKQLDKVMAQFDAVSNSIAVARGAIMEKSNLFDIATNAVALRKQSVSGIESNMVEYPVLVFADTDKEDVQLSEPLDLRLPPAVQYIDTPIRSILVKGEYLTVNSSNGTWRLAGHRCRPAYVINSKEADRIPFETCSVSNIKSVIMLDAEYKPNPLYGSARDQRWHALQTTITAYSISTSTEETRAVASFAGVPMVIGQGNGGLSVLKGNGYVEAMKAMQENFLNKL